MQKCTVDLAESPVTNPGCDSTDGGTVITSILFIEHTENLIQYKIVTPLKIFSNILINSVQL